MRRTMAAALVLALLHSCIDPAAQACAAQFLAPSAAARAGVPSGPVLVLPANLSPGAAAPAAPAGLVASPSLSWMAAPSAVVRHAPADKTPGLPDGTPVPPNAPIKAAAISAVDAAAPTVSPLPTPLPAAVSVPLQASPAEGLAEQRDLPGFDALSGSRLTAANGAERSLDLLFDGALAKPAGKESAAVARASYRGASPTPLAKNDGRSLSEQHAPAGGLFSSITQKDKTESLSHAQGVSRAAKAGYVTAFLSIVGILGTQALAHILGYTPHPNYSGPDWSGGMTPAKALELFWQAAIMAPVLEEIIFRWGMLRWLKNILSRVWVRGAGVAAAVVTSGVFVALHETSDPLYFAMRFAHAMVIAWVYEKYGLAGAITQHAYYNAAWFALAMAGIFFPGHAALAGVGLGSVGLLGLLASLRGLRPRSGSPVPGPAPFPFADAALLLATGLVFGSLIFWPAAIVAALPLAAGLALYAFLAKSRAL